MIHVTRVSFPLGVGGTNKGLPPLRRRVASAVLAPPPCRMAPTTAMAASSCAIDPRLPSPRSVGATAPRHVEGAVIGGTQTRVLCAPWRSATAAQIPVAAWCWCPNFIVKIQHPGSGSSMLSLISQGDGAQCGPGPSRHTALGIAPPYCASFDPSTEDSIERVRHTPVQLPQGASRQALLSALEQAQPTPPPRTCTRTRTRPLPTPTRIVA